MGEQPTLSEHGKPPDIPPTLAAVCRNLVAGSTHRGRPLLTLLVPSLCFEAAVTPYVASDAPVPLLWHLQEGRPVGFFVALIEGKTLQDSPSENPDDRVSAMWALICVDRGVNVACTMLASSAKLLEHLPQQAHPMILCSDDTPVDRVARTLQILVKGFVAAEAFTASGNAVIMQGTAGGRPN